MCRAEVQNGSGSTNVLIPGGARALGANGQGMSPGTRPERHHCQRVHLTDRAVSGRVCDCVDNPCSIQLKKQFRGRESYICCSARLVCSVLLDDPAIHLLRHAGSYIAQKPWHMASGRLRKHNVNSTQSNLVVVDGYHIYRGCWRVQQVSILSAAIEY